MSGLRLNVKIDALKALTTLQNLQDFKRDHGGKMFDEIGSYLVSEVTNRFRKEIDPEGNPTPQSQRAIEEGGITLVDHGHLRDSYTYQVFAGGSGVEIGSAMEYAAIHHFGGQAGRNLAVTLEARPKLGINDDDEQEIDAIVFDHLREAFRS